jgi:hypothetical protein
MDILKVFICLKKTKFKNENCEIHIFDDLILNPKILIKIAETNKKMMEDAFPKFRPYMSLKESMCNWGLFFPLIIYDEFTIIIRLGVGRSVRVS